MRFTLLSIALLATAACHRSPLRPGPEPAPASGPDSLYWKALSHLDAANRSGSLDTAVAALDAYLSTGATQARRQEALVLRQLARDSRQLARVEALLQQVRADSAPPPRAAGTDAEVRRRGEESVKEIQRLKEALAKANEELERIRKRLATPKPPGPR